MAIPITVTIFADDDVNQGDHLIVRTEPDLVLLSLEDQDEVRWVSTRGTATIDFAPANNPFDPSQFTGGEYVVPPGGSVTSGPPAAIVLQGEDDDVFRQFKYSISVVDGTRSGAVDPHARIRRKRVYRAEL